MYWVTSHHYKTWDSSSWILTPTCETFGRTLICFIDHWLSLFQVMDGDETLIDHRSHYLTFLLLLFAQNSPPLEKILTEFLRENDKMRRNRFMFRAGPQDVHRETDQLSADTSSFIQFERQLLLFPWIMWPPPPQIYLETLRRGPTPRLRTLD